MHLLALLAPALTAAGFAICEGALHLRERTGGRLGTQATRIIAVPFFIAAGWCASRDGWGLALGIAIAVGIWTEVGHGEGQGAETAGDEWKLLKSGWSRLWPAVLIALAHAAWSPSWWTAGACAALAAVATAKPPVWFDARLGAGERFWIIVGRIAKATDFDPTGGKNEATRRAAIVYGALAGLAVIA